MENTFLSHENSQYFIKLNKIFCDESCFTLIVLNFIVSNLTCFMYCLSTEKSVEFFEIFIEKLHYPQK